MRFLVFDFLGMGWRFFFNEQPSQGLEPFEGKIFGLLSFEFMVFSFLVFGFLGMGGVFFNGQPSQGLEPFEG